MTPSLEGWPTKAKETPPQEVRLALLGTNPVFQSLGDILVDSDWFCYMLESDLKSTQTNVLDLDWFYEILELNLKNTWTNLMGSYWLHYNQAGMLLKKYENLLQLPVKQLVIQSILASSFSLGQTMYGEWKIKCC